MKDTLKVALPGYGIAIIDPNEDDGEDRFDTPQVGTLITCNATKEDIKRYDYNSLLDRTVFWKKYADQDATFFDKDLQSDVVFIKLEAIVGFNK